MNRLWSLLLLALLLCAGCARSGSGSGIRSGVSMDSFPPPPGPPATVTIGELVEEPAAYEGQYVRVTGAYRRPPLLVCEGLPRHSPDGWALAEGEATIGAGGFNELLRSLLAEGTTMTSMGAGCSGPARSAVARRPAWKRSGISPCRMAWSPIHWCARRRAPSRQLPARRRPSLGRRRRPQPYLLPPALHPFRRRPRRQRRHSPRQRGRQPARRNRTREPRRRRRLHRPARRVRAPPAPLR